jgi:hypothetical protein
MQNEGTYKNSRKVRKPLISCDFDYEKRVEDPRVKIEETYYVTILLRRHQCHGSTSHVQRFNSF